MIKPTANILGAKQKKGVWSLTFSFRTSVRSPYSQFNTSPLSPTSAPGVLQSVVCGSVVPQNEHTAELGVSCLVLRATKTVFYMDFEPIPQLILDSLFHSCSSRCRVPYYSARSEACPLCTPQEGLVGTIILDFLCILNTSLWLLFWKDALFP